MNEEQFRQHLCDAIGEPPPSDLRRRLEARMIVGPSGRPSYRLGPLAATMALLIVASLVGLRLVISRRPHR